MKLLIVDDNAAVRTSLKLILRDEFESIVSVGDPTLIPAILGSGDIDIVVLDMNFSSSSLDGRDGIFWLDHIKAVKPAPAVVMITAFGDVPLAVEAMKQGAEDFVTKPWDNEKLISTLHNAIAKNRIARQHYATVERAKELEQIERSREEMTLDQIRADHVEKIVEQCGGNLSAASKKLDINRQTLYNILKKKG